MIYIYIFISIYIYRKHIGFCTIAFPLYPHPFYHLFWGTSSYSIAQHFGAFDFLAAAFSLSLQIVFVLFTFLSLCFILFCIIYFSVSERGL